MGVRTRPRERSPNGQLSRKTALSARVLGIVDIVQCVVAGQNPPRAHWIAKIGRRAVRVSVPLEFDSTPAPFRGRICTHGLRFNNRDSAAAQHPTLTATDTPSASPRQHICIDTYSSTSEELCVAPGDLPSPAARCSASHARAQAQAPLEGISSGICISIVLVPC